MRDLQRSNYTKLVTKSWLLTKIIGSFFIVFVYMLLIAPHFWKVLHFDWPLILLLFWHYAERSRIGVLGAWLVGLFTDVLLGTTLGLHASLYALSLYIVQLLHAQFHYNTILMQYVFVSVLLLIAAFVRFVFLQASSLLLTTETFVLIVQALLGAFMWVIVVSMIRTR